MQDKGRGFGSSALYFCYDFGSILGGSHFERARLIRGAGWGYRVSGIEEVFGVISSTLSKNVC